MGSTKRSLVAGPQGWLLALSGLLLLGMLVGGAWPTAVTAQTPPPPTRIDPGPGRPDPGPGRDTPVPPTTPGPVNPQPPETTPVVTPAPILPQTGQAARPALGWFYLGGALLMLGAGLVIFQRRQQRHRGS